MDQDLSRKNIHDGLWITLVILLVTALTVVAAFIYIA